MSLRRPQIKPPPHVRGIATLVDQSDSFIVDKMFDLSFIALYKFILSSIDRGFMQVDKINFLHQRALTLAEGYREHEKQLFDVLLQIDRAQGYLIFGYSCLSKYCVGALKLTEWQGYAFMAIARKSESVPELKEAVQNSEVSFSNASRIVSVITPENKAAWIEKAKNLSQGSLKRELAKANPEPPVKEGIRPTSENESELKVGLDAEMEADLVRVKEILAVNTKAALKAILKDFLKRHDPVQKAKRAQLRPTTVHSSANRYIARPIFHEVQRRDEGKCQFKGLNGQICGEKFGVHLHHLNPWGYGGRHEADNLLTLCSRHHRCLHDRTG